MQMSTVNRISFHDRYFVLIFVRNTTITSLYFIILINWSLRAIYECLMSTSTSFCTQNELTYLPLEIVIEIYISNTVKNYFLNNYFWIFISQLIFYLKQNIIDSIYSIYTLNSLPCMRWYIVDWTISCRMVIVKVPYFSLPFSSITRRLHIKK